MTQPTQAWGRMPTPPAKYERPLTDRHTNLPRPSDAQNTLLAHGWGRSYGDVALNPGHTLLHTRHLDRFMAFDPATGVLRAEAGVSLDAILRLVIPQGWFLPVTPGTRFVTLGGAVANDVHGKNHHVMGSFGDHVRALELLRSDGSRQQCSATQHPDWFRATVGGLGLTGLITWVEIGLRRIAQPDVQAINRRFASIDDYWALDAHWMPRCEYAVAWVDCLRGGRGIYTAGLHAGAQAQWRHPPAPQRQWPMTPPLSLVNRASVWGFNWLYYHRPLPPQTLMPWPAFFYPLDGIGQWNRMYGPRGFIQYQCVLPPATMRDASRELLRLIGSRGQGSFLAVFKTFGNRTAPGMLSFPRPGSTLALDFPFQGEATLRLCHELDAVVREAQGALYPAKDARMPGSMFRAGYPDWEAFSTYVDPAFSSGFWRRVQT
ncbi:FAD-binding oxidoreductase [Vitreoscilla filiformis]|uniref:FAD-binding oxidoreductase n=1 Tax=Vitreoscilla filiformis TaxID=63 RepID=UPI000B7AE8D6|nr:FAD-binding oxidoreductase [Vitreoscilla filiformis]